MLRDYMRNKSRRESPGDGSRKCCRWAALEAERTLGFSELMLPCTDRSQQTLKWSDLSHQKNLWQAGGRYRLSHGVSSGSLASICTGSLQRNLKTPSGHWPSRPESWMSWAIRIYKGPGQACWTWIQFREVLVQYWGNGVGDRKNASYLSVY